MPPGPLGLPFIGNLHQFDSLTPHIYFWKLSKKYGKIFSLKIGSATMVVISSAKLVKEVTHMQDSIFCSRASFLGQQKLSYNGHDMTFAPYNDYWRKMRKVCVVHLFSLKKVQSFSPIRQDEVSNMMKQISQQASASQIINLSNIDILTGGTETIAAAVEWAMTALIKNPKAMKKVQQEIRQSIGNKGIVNEDDIQNMSYFKAVIKEIFRLYPPAPLLGPRETMKKSTLEGYEIQPGTIIHVNLWAIARDPEIWENSEEFMHERFLNSVIDFKGQDFEFIPFGAGRRSCPGLALGIATINLIVSNLLYAFDWELPYGMMKEEIDTDVLPGLIMHKKNDLYLVPKNYSYT